MTAVTLFDFLWVNYLIWNAKVSPIRAKHLVFDMVPDCV
jgi:hypothetical protein